ncbi:MAG: hypothetical protein HYV36_06275 [Lentisphaerae bacterium]|nr:hypothetical protein [Lentisphaerota bacterium]
MKRGNKIRPLRPGVSAGIFMAMLVVFFNSVGAVHAQSVFSRVIQVAAPGAVCAAVQDDSARLVVGVRGTGDCHLAVFPLDPTGNVVSTGMTRLVLPKIAALKDYTPYPLDAAWHPRLPLLYVWQDVAGPEVAAPAKNPVFGEFDHLAVYSLTGGVLQCVQSYARGGNYAWGLSTGRIALDPEGKRLFLPNLRNAATGRSQIGYLILNTNGLPLVVEGRAEPAVVDVGDVRANPSGFGFLAVTSRVMIFSGVSGPVTWDTENRRAALGCLMVRGIPAGCFVGGRPEIAAVFGAAQHGSFVYRVAQVDGFLTLLPQVMTVAGAVFAAPPVVMPGKPDCLALGGAAKIHFLRLDNAGRMTEPVEELPIACPAVQALAYSRKFDRLYVAVERLP